MTFIFVSYSCICFYNRHFPVYLRELDDIMRGRQILVDLIERNALPVFKDINTALKCSAHVLQKVAINTVKHSKETGSSRPRRHGNFNFSILFSECSCVRTWERAGSSTNQVWFPESWGASSVS